MQSVKEINPQYVTNQAGKKTAVLLPIAEFEQLLEDLDDLARIADRRDEETIPHEIVREQLKADGLI